MMTLSKTNNGRKMYYTPDYFGGVFDTFFNDNLGRQTVSRRVPTNISENDEAYHIELAIPGFSKSHVNIQVEEDLLKITGKKEEEKSEVKYTRKDFSSNEFEKSYRLPETVEVEKIKAEFKDGILSIELPKKEPAKPVSIKIDVK